MFQHALVATKGYPLHLGHDYLIQEALRLSERLTILLVWDHQEIPNVDIRLEWFKTAYPTANTVAVVNLATDDDDPKSSILWAEYARDILDGDPIDVVFSSEQYGDWWATALGVEHVMVDKLRTMVPVSGTAIRTDPYLHWQYIHPVARPEYLKRVLVVGAESTGKTTLCQRLANAYGTFYVPEYGRRYVEKKGSLEATDHRVIFGEIVNRQPKLAEEIESRCRLVAFHDTDLITTALWYKLWQPDSGDDALYQNILDEGQACDLFDLVLISDHEGTDWVDDGLRDQKDTRQWFTEEFERTFGGRAHILRGSWDDRFLQAINLTNDLFKGSQVFLPRYGVHTVLVSSNKTTPL